MERLPHYWQYIVGSSTFIFGFEAPKEGYYQSVDMDRCLCPVDIEKALKDHNIPFKTDRGDFYVGQLDEVVGDAD